MKRFLARACTSSLLAACFALPARAQQPAPSPAAPAAAQEPAPQPSSPLGKVPPGVHLQSQMPAAAAPRPFDFPRPATKLLPNGLEVFVVPRNRQPAVSITLLIPFAGSFFDPPGKTGLASLAAAVLPEGTTHRSAQEIAEAIDFVGGSLTTGAEGDAANVTVTVMKKDFLLAMDLLSDVVLHPIFQPQEVERKRRQTLSNLEVESVDPGYLTQVVSARVLYGLHPYGMPEDGTADSVKAIAPDDLHDFQKARYVPQGSFLSIAGDVTPDEAFAAAQKFLGDWAGVAPAFTAPAIPAASSGLRFVLVDKPDSVQTQIRASRAAIPRNSPDYLPLFVANRVFGGGENSRLNASIRQKKGLTYGAYSQLAGRARAGSLSAGLSTRTETTLEALHLLLDLMSQMSSGDVSPDELRFAKDYLAGAFPMQSETPEQVAGRILSLSLYGLPADYFQHYRENLQAVSAVQVKALAAQYFGASNLSIVMVGNVGAFREALKKAYPGARIEEVAVADLDLLAPALRRKLSSPSPDAGVPAPTPETLDEGRALLASAAKTAGGEALAGIKSVDVTAQGKLYQQSGDADVELHLQVSYPDHMRLDMKLPEASVTQGFDGTVGWLQFPGGVSEVSPDAVSEFRRSILLTGAVGIVNAAQAGTLEVQFLGEEEVEGKQTRAALWRGPSGPVRLYVDIGSHFLVAARFLSGSPHGPAETLQTWDDYRDVEGVQFPFHTVTYQNGVRHSEIFVQQVRLNQPMDASLFAKPGS
ncbi:MAG TPA: pitrilysin family protein [Candidatus Acidoferrales bacterium]|nr:pitrilysin family protein [Candidatus Acidoferrales bacterium]